MKASGQLITLPNVWICNCKTFNVTFNSTSLRNWHPKFHKILQWLAQLISYMRYCRSYNFVVIMYMFCNIWEISQIIFYLVFEDLQRTPDGDRYRSKHVALKIVVFGRIVCTYIADYCETQTNTCIIFTYIADYSETHTNTCIIFTYIADYCETHTNTCIMCAKIIFLKLGLPLWLWG